MGETYVPLARKWRPRSFADVVGQEEIVRALTNAVAQDRIAHAYLFSGPRGVGKTTTARLLAAAINCSSSPGPTPTPCGTCVACTEIFEGRSIDALEIDGATHGKVDQARDLIEVVAFAPVRDRRKVFIIDEVHAISAAAFQALLKTLEEPPAHAVFVLATTERHKIPATILSRCQRFDFRRLTDEEVGDRLAEIARREGLPVPEPAAVSALAAAATGSLRDALSLFDQAAARSGGKVTAADVAALLGAPDRSTLVALFASLLGGDRAAVLKGCAELEASGSDPRATLRDLTAIVRGTLRLAADPAAPPPAGLSEEGAARLAEFAKGTPYATLLRMLSLLSDGDALLRRADLPSLAFEVLLLKLAELPRLVPIEEILSGKTGALASLSLPPSAVTSSGVADMPLFSSKGGNQEAETTGTRTSESDRGGERRETSSSRAGGAGASAASSSSKKISGSALPSAPASPDAGRTAPPRSPSFPKAEESPAPRFVGLTPLEIEPEPLSVPDAAVAFRAEVEKRHSTLGAVLEDASVRVEGRCVRIVLDPPSPEMEKRLAEPGMRKVLEEAAAALLGKRAEVVVEGAMPPAGDLTAAAAAADPASLERENLKKRAIQDEKVRKMLDMFGGEIVDVKRDDRRDG
ncbi:MAG: DNA polymerase III subunit gamma/tau [Acidithiobacillales bacterium]